MIDLIHEIDTHLSEAQIKAYKRDGFLHIKNILNADEVEALRAAVTEQVRSLSTTTTGYDFESLANQLWSGSDTIETGNAARFELELFKHVIETDTNARPIRDNTNAKLDKDGMFFYDAAGWRKFQEIREVAFDSRLPTVCAKLLNTKYLNFWEDTTFVKAPNTYQRTTFHQDYTYFQISGAKCCIAWIPLDPATKDTGAMQYVRGSHLWDKQFAPNMFITQTPMLDAEDPKLPDIEARPEDYDIVTIEAEPGDIIIHDVLTIHGSGGNLSKEQTRRAMSFRYCGDDIRYYDRPGAIPQPYITKPLPDGSPLYSDDYPLVWPKPAPNLKIAPLFAGMSCVE